MQVKLTPMIQQYKKIKRSVPQDCILLFRMGDFYEMFFEDATIASKVLNITLTRRSREAGRDYPMCGIPYHAADSYIGKLVKAGRKVAVCDQVEDPKLAKGLVRRDVTKLITPGTVLDCNLLEEKKNNFLAAVCKAGKVFGISYLDLSTGEFRVTEVDSEEDFFSEFMRIEPSECIISEGLKPDFEKIRRNGSMLVNYYQDWMFDYDNSYAVLKDHFKTQSLDGYGCQGMVPGVAAAGSILNYLKENMYKSLGHIQRIVPYTMGDYMMLDNSTIKNLELVSHSNNGSGQTTLFGVIDYTATSMGARLLQRWIKQPLVRVQQIKERQEGARYFYNNKTVKDKLQEVLSNIPDIERIIGRINSGYANARDLVALKEALNFVPVIKSNIKGTEVLLLKKLVEDLFELPDLVGELENAFIDSPPFNIRQGGFIKDGYSGELDEVRTISKEAKNWLTNLELREIENTGIKSLKVRYNKVFGYYIEVSKTNLASVPEHYDRKQTLVNAERFIIPELKDHESKILNAKERIGELEYNIFVELRDKVNTFTAQLQKIAGVFARLDVLLSFSEACIRNNYIFPEINDDSAINITGGRHPVLEKCMEGGKRFVSNDTLMDSSLNQLFIITGPNMAGKSTYIRQVALLVLMAQIGCGIPAESAVIGAVDRIFTRVGASDELTRGNSTFMVEMNETSYILNNSTEKSLIVLDEIGRGTSTYDGISIAWAVAEFLVNNRRGADKQEGPKTLFATHYHELTKLADTYEMVKNYNIAVKEWNDEIIFLYKIVSGSTDRSYGIHVARLAGLPYGILERAKEIMNELETGSFVNKNTSIGKTKQMYLFDMPRDHIVDFIRSMNLDYLTPIEALNKLKELKEKVN